MAVTFLGTARSIVTFGNDATTQNLFTIENGVASYVDVNIRRLMLQNDAIALLTAVMPIVKSSRATSISGGFTLDKTAFDTTLTSDSNVVFRAQIDDSARITATPGDTIWQQYSGRLHTAAEQQQGIDNNMLPLLVADTGKEFVLHPGQSLLCQVVASAGTSNAIGTNNWFIECVFEEVSLSTFAISGTVTLSGTPQAGAIVTVMEADDLDGTNIFLRDIIVTPAGGTWNSTIRTGKVGFVSYQYRNGGTYYNALNSPYLS